MEPPPPNRSKRKRERISSQAVTGNVVFEELVTPNFEELGRHFPAFGKAWRDVEAKRAAAHGPLSAHITQEFSITLAKALLHVHWGLSLTNVPSDHLCPPIPNRYFYVRWMLQDVLPSTERNYRLSESQKSFMKSPVRALDIGTGAFCIYALLLAASLRHSTETTSTIFATDIDPESIHLAHQNVQSNNLQSIVRVLPVPPTDTQQLQSNPMQSTHDDRVRVGPLRQSLDVIAASMGTSTANHSLHFCMTNPPFFDDSINSERTDPRQGDQRQRTAMTAHEGSYPGGEVAFVLDMIVDGLYLFAQCTSDNNQTCHPPPIWSSCMCGKKTSWVTLKGILTNLLGPAHVVSAEFGPGHLMRWFLAWTLERPIGRSPLAQCWTLSFTVTLPNDTDQSVESKVGQRILEYCETFPMAKLAVETVNHRHLCIREYFPVTGLDPDLDESRFPDSIRRVLNLCPEQRRMDFLPVEGHFLVDVLLTTEGNHVRLEIEAFRHSNWGKRVLDKIKSQLEGDICRTSRRWRRKLQRELQERPNDAMDTS